MLQRLQQLLPIINQEKSIRYYENNDDQSKFERVGRSGGDITQKSIYKYLSTNNLKIYFRTCVSIQVLPNL